jgi:hypothetical protein
MNKKTVWVATAVLALAASAASANSLTFQNVTFGTTDLGGGELQLTIDNALNAGGDWSNIKYLEAFSLNDVGTFTSASLTGFTYNPGGLSNGSSTGCDSSASPGFACFLSTGGPTALTNSMVFDVFFTGGTPDFSLPHLKVDFWADSSQTKSTGSLLSLDIPAGPSPPTSVPEPATLGLFGLGLTAVGFARRRRSA